MTIKSGHVAFDGSDAHFVSKFGYEKAAEMVLDFKSVSHRQCVTGLVVNEKLSVPAEYKRRLRAQIFYSLKYGLADCISHCNLQDFIIEGRPDEMKYFNHLSGELNYVLCIEPGNKWFKSVYEKFSLLNPLSDCN